MRQNYSLTEVYFLRVLMEHQRVGTQTHTNRAAASVASRPGIAVAVSTVKRKYEKSTKKVRKKYERI
jgi:hypothetical protein